MESKLLARCLLLLLLCSTGAFCAGIVNGLLGTGGGIILTFLFAFVFKGTLYDHRDCLVSAMAVILPVSVLSLTTYEAGYITTVTDLLAVVIPSSLGGLAGAWLSRRLRPVILEKIFAVLVIYAGINMIL